jgi:sulfite exporter TauE/SafE
MCGPISIAMQGQGTLPKFILSRSSYNSGRITTYAIIGLCFGLLGEYIALAEYQLTFSVFLGTLMITMASAMVMQWLNTNISPILVRGSQIFKKWLGQWMNKSALSSAFVLGMINGFLPCGLVYVAIVGALATTNLIDSILYMAAFGLGTFPAMLLVALTGKAIKVHWLNGITKFSTLLIFILGGLLIVRGLNLNIPYLSPLISFLYPNAGIPNCQ